MEKIWTSVDKGDTSIIAINEDIIYFGNVRLEEIENFVSGFKLKIVPKKLFSLPISYIIKISMQEQKNQIKIFYRGNSKDELVISDQNKRDEIFSYLKTIRPNIQYSTFEQSKIQACKKPLIALCVTTAIFIWALYFYVEMQAGTEYRIRGNPGVAGIALAIASMGITTMLCIFIPLILIAITMTLKKMRNLAKFHILIFRS